MNPLILVILFNLVIQVNLVILVKLVNLMNLVILVKLVILRNLVILGNLVNLLIPSDVIKGKDVQKDPKQSKTWLLLLILSGMVLDGAR